MTRSRLSGVLRVRRLQADAMRARLQQANAGARLSAEAYQRAHAELAGQVLATDRVGGQAAFAAAVARRTALTEDRSAAGVRAERARDEVTRADAAWTRSRVAERAVEKLVERAAEDAERARLRSEQLEIDDMASRMTPGGGM